MADADLTANLDASGFERGTEVVGRSVGELLSTVQRLQGIGEEPIGAGLADVLLDLPEIAQEAMDGVNRSLGRIGTGGGGKSTLDALKAQFKGLEEAADRVLSGAGSNAKIDLFPGGEAGLRRMVAGVIDEYATGIRRANAELLDAGKITPGQARGTETYLGNVEGRNDARLFGANEEASRRYNEQLARATESRTQAETGLTDSARRLKAAQDQESEELEARRFLGRIGATNQQPSPFRESEQPQQSPRPAAPPATSPFAPAPEAPPAARPAGPPVGVPFSDPEAAPTSPARPTGPVSDPFTLNGRPQIIHDEDDSRIVAERNGERVGHLSYDRLPNGAFSVGQAKVNFADRDQGVYSQMREELYRLADQANVPVYHGAVFNPFLHKSLASDPRLQEESADDDTDVRSFVYHPNQRVASAAHPLGAITPEIAAQADARNRALAEQAVQAALRPAAPYGFDHPNRVPEGVRDYGKTEGDPAPPKRDPAPPHGVEEIYSQLKDLGGKGILGEPWYQHTIPAGESFSGIKAHVYGDVGVNPESRDAAELVARLQGVITDRGLGSKFATPAMARVLHAQADVSGEESTQARKAATLYFPRQETLEADLKAVAQALEHYAKGGNIAGDQMATRNLGLRYEFGEHDGGNVVGLDEYQKRYTETGSESAVGNRLIEPLLELFKGQGQPAVAPHPAPPVTFSDAETRPPLTSARPTTIPADPFTGEQRAVDNLVLTTYDFKQAAEETHRVAAAQEAFAGGHVPGGTVPPNGPNGPGGGSGGASSGGGEPRTWALSEMSEQEMADAVRTRARGIAQVANTGNFVVPEWNAAVRYNPGQKATKEEPAVDPHWEEILNPLSRLLVSNIAKPGTLGGAAEGVIGDARSAAFRPVSNLFDPNETSQSQYALAQRIRESRQPHGGYDPSYSENVQPDFTPVKNSTTLFRDLDDQLVKVTRDLASYNVTIQDQITADKARTEEDLRQVELNRGEAIQQGLPGFERISDKGNFYNTPQGAPAILRSDGRASIALNNREQMGADKAIEDEKRAAEEKATADRMYAQALKGSRLNNIAVNNPADEMRDLGNGYKQLGEVLYKQVGEGMRVVEGQKELYEASLGLAKKLEAQGRSQVDQGIWKSFLGGAFGHGFESNQQFKPADALKNLAGTAGVLARYGGEGRLLFGAMDGVKDAVNQFSEYQKAMIDLRSAQDALTESGVSAKNARVDLNEATNIGAKYGLDELASMAAGTAGLKAYSEELKGGKSAADIFSQSVQAAGVAAVLTGKSAAEMFPTQTAITNEFQLGAAGLPRVNDAAVNAARHFNVPMDRILTGMQESGDLANVAGFDPERQAATVAAVDDYTGKDSGPQIARELSQGGSARFRTAVAQLGVPFNASDIGGTLAKAGDAYKNFDGAQKQAFATMLGGSRTAETVIALLERQSKIAETTADSYKDQGRALEEANAKQKTFGGEMNQLHTLVTNLATDLGKIGLVSFFGDVLIVAKPVIGAFDDLAKLLDIIPSQLKQVLVGLAAVRGLSALGGGAGILGATAGTVGPRAQVGSALTNARTGAGRIYGGTVGRVVPGNSERSKATTGHTADVVKDAAATKDHTAAVIGDTTAAKAEAEAGAAEVKATERRAEADTASAEAADKKTAADILGADAAEKKAVADNLGQRVPGRYLGEELPQLGRADRLANRIPGVSDGVGGGGLLGLGLVGMIGGELIKGAYEKTTSLLDARTKADNAVQGGVSVDPEANRTAAGDAQAAAVGAEQARSGVVGHILDWVSGGSNNEIGLAKNAATIRNDLATQLDKDAQQGTQNGQVMSLDISSPEALKNSLTALDATGASAKESVDALKNAMDNLAASGMGAAGRLNPTDITKVSHVGGAAASNSINQGVSLASDLLTHPQFITGHVAADDVNQFTWGSDQGSHGQRQKSYTHDVSAVSKAKGDLATAADKAVNDYLTQNPGYNPAKDQPKLVDFIATALTAVPGMEGVDSRTVHSIAVDVASQVRGAAQGLVAPQNATDATVQAGFTESLSRAAIEGPLQGARVESGEVDPAHPNDSGATADARYQLDTAKYQLNNAMTTKGKDGKRLATDSEIADDRAKVEQLQLKFNQSIASDLQDQLKINQANRALTDTLGRGQDAIDALTKQIAQEATTDPRQAKIDTAAMQELQKQQAQETTQTQAAGISVGLNDATTGSSIGGASANYDPRDVLGNAQRQQSGDLLVFNQIDAAEKGMPQHSTAWIDAFKKVQEDKTAIANDENEIANSALDAATRPGDAMDAAQKAVQKAKNTLATKRPGSAEYSAAQAVLNQANYDDAQKAAEDQNARNNAAIMPGDTTQAARAAIGNATNKLNADAKDSTQYFIDLAALKAAQYQYAQNLVGLANAEITAHVFPGDAVGAAEAQVTTLTNQLAAEHDPAKWWQEWGQLQQAKVALSHAEVDAASVAATLQSDTTNPVAMAKVAADKARQTYAVDAANRNLTGAARTRVLNQDILTERQTQNAAERSAFDQWLSDTQINMELGRTSFATYMQLLEGRDSMLKAERARMKVGSDGYRQMTDEINQTEQTIHSALNQLSGQFNIGQDIKLPTVYEVRRSLGTAAGGTGYNDNRTVSIVINGVGSTQEVVQIVKQQLGTQATVTRGPTTARKV